MEFATAIKQYAAYQNIQHNTTSKTQQVVMLYEAIIKYLNKSIISIQEKNIQDRYNNIERACKIILTLQSALDFDRGGKVAVVLDHYYHHMDMRLIKIQRTNNIEHLKEIIGEIELMKDAWDQIYRMDG
ncbi:MAG: flagellar export chaperone FliS [Pseudomonadota bacterium]